MGKGRSERTVGIRVMEITKEKMTPTAAKIPNCFMGMRKAEIRVRKPAAVVRAEAKTGFAMSPTTSTTRAFLSLWSGAFLK